MVLAKRKKLNVFHYYHLIMFFVKHSTVHNVMQFLFVAFSEKEHCLRIAHWRITQANSVLVLTHTFKYRLYSARQLGQRFIVFLVGRLLPPQCPPTFDLSACSLIFTKQPTRPTQAIKVDRSS